MTYQPILDPAAQALAAAVLNALADTAWSPPPFYRPRPLFVGPSSEIHTL